MYVCVCARVRVCVCGGGGGCLHTSLHIYSCVQVFDCALKRVHSCAHTCMRAI